VSTPFDPSDPPSPPAPEEGADPFVDELVERAAARYAGLVDPKELAAMKDELRMFLTAHPRASVIVDRARGRGRDRSGRDAVPGVPAPTTGGEADAKLNGKPR
jgi:hypothetical protein